MNNNFKFLRQIKTKKKFFLNHRILLVFLNRVWTKLYLYTKNLRLKLCVRPTTFFRFKRILKDHKIIPFSWLLASKNIYILITIITYLYSFNGTLVVFFLIYSVSLYIVFSCIQNIMCRRCGIIYLKHYYFYVGFKIM